MAAPACMAGRPLELLSDLLEAEGSSSDAGITAKLFSGVTWPSKQSTDVLTGRALNPEPACLLQNLCACRRSTCTSLWQASTRSGGMTLPVAFLRSSVEMAQSATSIAGAAVCSQWLHVTAICIARLTVRSKQR